MPFQRIVTRKLPDGKRASVYPFHLSLEGLQSNLLCREEEDYDVIEKLMFVSAWTANILVITHVVMSTHGHMAVLAPNIQQVLIRNVPQTLGNVVTADFAFSRVVPRVSFIVNGSLPVEMLLGELLVIHDFGSLSNP